MQKYLKDGLVAIIYSPHYGAGWSTWNKDNKQCIFDPFIVEQLIQNNSDCYDVINKYVDENYPKRFCKLGLRELKLQWLPIGTKFYIDEYDGYESVKVVDSTFWIEA